MLLIRISDELFIISSPVIRLLPRFLHRQPQLSLWPQRAVVMPEKKKSPRRCPADALSWWPWSISSNEETKKKAIRGGGGRWSQRENVSLTDIIKASSTRFCSNTHFPQRHFPPCSSPWLCFCLCVSSHMKKSFCGYSILTVFATLEKKKKTANDHCLSCWWTVGRVFEHCGFLLDRDKKKNNNKKVFIRMWFLKSAKHFWLLIQLIALVDTWKWVASYQMKLDYLYLVLLSGTER